MNYYWCSNVTKLARKIAAYVWYGGCAGGSKKFLEFPAGGDERTNN
jgi:hypothetical protein